VLKQTTAKVDKVNKEISMVVAETDANKSNIANLYITTDEIKSNVSSMKTALDETSSEMETLKHNVDMKLSAEDVRIEISTELEKGVSKVVTDTGFKFDSDGLTVSKSGTEMTTTITEDGMTVYRDSNAVLNAKHSGVDAVNLHATTFLIIGNNSRFEDYGRNRTGCFWIGG
jgi:hypothetical protein